MRKTLCALTGLAVLASVANAETINFFASTSGTDGAIPAEMPAVMPGDTLYLWADTRAPQNGKWLGFDFAIDGAEGSVFQGEIERWEADSDLTVDPRASVVSVTSNGLGGFAEFGDSLYDGAAQTYAVAMLTVTGDPGTTVDMSLFAAVHLGSAPGEDMAAISGGDAVANDLFSESDPLTGTLATIVPEPTSLVLLALAGLAIRRR
jgi:hypothetical protein